MTKVTVRRTGLLAPERRGKTEDLIKAVHEHSVHIWEQSVIVFVKEALRRTPVATGMSAFSLIPTANEVNKIISFRLQSTITPKRRPQKGYISINTNTKVNRLKSPAAGARLGEKAFNINFGKPKRPVFFFSFKHVVWQHLHSDLGTSALGFSVARQSIEFGRKAQENFLNQRWRKAIDDLVSIWLRTGRIPGISSRG